MKQRRGQDRPWYSLQQRLSGARQMASHMLYVLAVPVVGALGLCWHGASRCTGKVRKTHRSVVVAAFVILLATMLVCMAWTYAHLPVSQLLLETLLGCRPPQPPDQNEPPIAITPVYTPFLLTEHDARLRREDAAFQRVLAEYLPLHERIVAGQVPQGEMRFLSYVHKAGLCNEMLSFVPAFLAAVISRRAFILYSDYLGSTAAPGQFPLCFNELFLPPHEMTLLSKMAIVRRYAYQLNPFSVAHVRR